MRKGDNRIIMPKHGNLTRAGKVRKQTPYVDPKDRPKKKVVGRALKRKKYSRRYDTLVLTTDGRRKKVKLNSKEEKRK